LAVFIVALILAAAASNTRGALSATLWILAAASLSIAIYTRTPRGWAALAHRSGKAKGATASEQNDKQRLTKPKPPKLLPLGQTKGEQGVTRESKANLKPRNRPRPR
jgi:hypothetical protein